MYVSNIDVSKIINNNVFNYWITNYCYTLINGHKMEFKTRLILSFTNTICLRHIWIFFMLELQFEFRIRLLRFQLIAIWFKYGIFEISIAILLVLSKYDCYRMILNELL